MQINVNCQSNDNGAWCKDKRVPRTKLLWIIPLARCCTDYGNFKNECPYKNPYPRPKIKTNKGFVFV